MQYIILIIILLAEFVTTPKTLLFYDQIEYFRIVSTHSFWQVFALGHFPIHPFFLSIFWITSHITLANYTSFIFGAISLLLMYLISKEIFRDKYFWISVVLFLLFPGVWLVNTNLMIQSVLLTFYLLSIYAFIKNKYLLFFISNFLMVGIHIDALYWILSIFLIPFLFKKEIKMNTKKIIKFGKIGFLSIVFSVLFYVLMYVFIIKNFGGSTEQLQAYSSFGMLRIIRNIWVCVINNFGSITPFIFLLLLIKNVQSKTIWFCWIIFAFLLSIGGAYWAGDLMMRRIVFGGVIISLTLYKYLGKRVLFIILLLIPVTAFNSVLYYKNLNNMPLPIMQKNIDNLPKNQVLISSHYYFPFIKYDGKILWFETDNLDQLESILKNGTRVFMTKESITAPYLLVVGNNYHITSLNKIGNSESRKLFTKYKVIPYSNSFELKEPDGKDISISAGEPVVFYGKGFWQRLSRMRINYGDIGIWIWSLVTNHKDPTGWTYKDVTGSWVSP